MRQKINLHLLNQAQQYAKNQNHHILQQLYRFSYALIDQVLSPVNRKFNNICIHGNYPHLVFPQMKNQLAHQYTLNAHSRIVEAQNQQFKIDFLSEGEFKKKNQEYDLIISCLESHHGNFQNNIKDYMDSLQPDGALVGCAWAENTLKQLHWAYLMAENQRCGGISPKVYGFPSIGTIGNIMHATKVQMPTILVKDVEIEVQSVLDLLTILQLTGESGFLHGRRKAVFPDLLLAMSALYDSEFRQPTSEKRVRCSLQFAMFIGWKYHENQNQPLKRSQLVNKTFMDELRKYDPELTEFTIQQQDDIQNDKK